MFLSNLLQLLEGKYIVRHHIVYVHVHCTSPDQTEHTLVHYIDTLKRSYIPSHSNGETNKKWKRKTNTVNMNR